MAIKILHLSDIHWSDKPDGLDTYKEIREAFLVDIKDYCDAQNKIDYILICGDIAFSGNEKEYNRANTFIQKVCEITQCSKENVLMVPGNHDKNRGAKHMSMRKLVYAGLSAHSNRDSLLNQYFCESPELVNLMFEPFRDYCDFSNGYSSAEPIMLRSLQTSPEMYRYDEKKDKLYWETPIDEINGYKIVVYGFNSALICDEHDWGSGKDDVYSHKMILPQIAYRIPKDGADTIRIMMAHHPVEYLESTDSIKEELCRLFQIQFYGHVHKYTPKIENNSLIIHSGAFQPDGKPTKEYCPIYNIVDIDIERCNGKESHLKVSTDIQQWDMDNNNGFISTGYETYKIIIPQHKNRFPKKNQWEPAQMKDPIISKRKVRIALANEPEISDTVRHFTKEVNVDGRIRYDIECDFLDWIEKNNKWSDLLHYIESK